MLRGFQRLLPNIWNYSNKRNDAESSFIEEKIVGKLLKTQNTDLFRFIYLLQYSNGLEIYLHFYPEETKPFEFSLTMENLTSPCRVSSLHRYCLSLRQIQAQITVFCVFILSIRLVVSLLAVRSFNILYIYYIYIAQASQAGKLYNYTVKPGNTQTSAATMYYVV